MSQPARPARRRPGGGASGVYSSRRHHLRHQALAIVGASRPEQVFDNARAAGITLSADTLAAIDEALGDVVVREFRLAAGARDGVRHR